MESIRDLTLISSAGCSRNTLFPPPLHLGNLRSPTFSESTLQIVEGLYCKRPIQCLASSKILTPHPLTSWRVCTPPPRLWCMGRTHSLGAGWREGVRVNSSEDARHCSVFYICRYFVLQMLAVRQARARFSARHHREVFPTELTTYKRWGDGERPRRMATDKCIVLYECDCMNLFML